MAKYILSIDQGTTSTRALLFDKDGQPVAKEQRDITQHYPKPGWAEHDPKEILDSVVNCCSGVLKKASATKDDIAAIGITNQRETTIAWNKETGEPFHNAIVWLDLRTSETVASITRGSGKDKFRKKTGLPVSTYFSAVKMKWLLENIPEVKEAATNGQLMFGTVESWLIYHLTGGAKDAGVHITDVSNASRYMLMNLQKMDWDQAICTTLGIPINALPAIKSNSEVYGRVKGFGILDGLPISGALGDQHAALLGQGCLEVGSSKNTYGTGCFMLLNTGFDAVPSRNGLLTTIGYKLGSDAKTVYALEGSVACAGRTVQWLRDNLGLIKDASEIEALASSVEDTGGVTLVPAFSGLFAPHWREDARAIVVGMTLFTKKEHVCRAALESVAFSTVDVMRAMRNDTGLRLGDMHVDGGMTANSFLMQLQADLLGVDVLRARMPEATVLGAAVAAGLAVGFYGKVNDVKEMIAKAGGHERFGSRLKPPARAIEFARWQDAVNRAFDLERWNPKQSSTQSLELRRPRLSKVSKINPESKGLNLFLKVVQILGEKSGSGGETQHDVICADQTGSVTLRLQPDQFLTAEVGKYISVQNAKVSMVQGHVRVVIDKWGKVKEAAEPDGVFVASSQPDVSAQEHVRTRAAIA